MEQFFHALWYNKRLRLIAYLLTPLSLCYWLGSKVNSWLGKKQRIYFNIPIIVVGNLTTGGTGKTPVLMALAEALKKDKLKVGIVSRGYKSLAEYADAPVLINKSHTALEVGDEPLLIFEKTGVPMVVHANRPQAIQVLLKKHPKLDIILSDDGLQNSRLPRDLEVIVTGTQGFGNGLFLPAGPLRESKKRLKTADFCIENGKNFWFEPKELISVIPARAGVQRDGNTQLDPHLLGDDKVVHAVAGIGHPERFFKTLKDLGFKVIPHVFPDHHSFLPTDFMNMDDHPIIMTEKDMVKCRKFDLNKAYTLIMTGSIAPQLLHDFLTKVRYTIAHKKENIVQLKNVRKFDEQKST